jgi:hypothetical protein
MVVLPDDDPRLSKHVVINKKYSCVCDSITHCVFVSPIAKHNLVSKVTQQFMKPES